VTDLLAYWNLAERPFEATWDTRFFYHSRHHEEALNRLCFLAGERSMNMGMLTGEIGCGKTLTRALFAKTLDPRLFLAITEENSAFSTRELIASIVRALAGDARPSGAKAALFGRLKQIAMRLHEERRHLVLIFDEAQEMSPATLNELKLLTNFNADGQSYLTVILVGQPELRQLVAQNPATNQRVSLRFHLGRLNGDETGDYLRHRLRAAGHPTGDLVAPDALAPLFQASQGIPRQVNRLAKLALEYAWLRGLPSVSAEAVETVVRDLDRQQHLGGP
jgi:general secretion pathway protein A